MLETVRSNRSRPVAIWLLVGVFMIIVQIILGGITRPGPSGFFLSYGRYRDFSRIMRLTDSLDVVVRSATPNDALAAIFGKPYSRKVLWP